MPNRVALYDIRQNVRRRADMENSTFCTDSEVDDYINHAWHELYDILIQKYEEDYFLKSSNISLAASTDSYDLPDDFYKVRGIDFQLNTNDWTPLQRYRFTQRTRAPETLKFVYNFKYRIQGEKIFFTPIPSSSDTVRVWYIPNPRFVETTSPTVISRGSTTTWTADPKNFAVDDYVKGFNFTATTGNYNVVQKVTAVGAATITTDFNSSGTSDPLTYGEITSMVDAYSGWDEYILVDAAIRCMIKEESDIQPLLVQKDGLLKRIVEASSQRDAGEPMRVTDVADYDNIYMY